MTPDQDGLEPYDPAANPADTATEFEDDDREDDRVEDGAPALALLAGSDSDG
jgi:hypothetical protein